MTKQQQFSTRLKFLRAEHKVTQEKLAQDLYLTRSKVKSYETDRAEPDLATLIHIADYFDVSIDYLIGRTDVKYTPNLKNNLDIYLLESLKDILSNTNAKNQRYIITYIIKLAKFLRDDIGK